MRRLPRIIGEKKFSDLKTTFGFISQWYDLNPNKWKDFKNIVEIYISKLN